MSKVLLVGVEIRVQRGQCRGGLTKIRLATIASLKATSRRIVGNEKKKNASDDGARDATSNADANNMNDSDDGGVLVATHGYKVSDEWIFDSGCTFHMTPNKTFFKTLKSVDGGDVTIGNNTTCKVVGVGV